jgi:ATP-dependent helicase/nuclease subunit B
LQAVEESSEEMPTVSAKKLRALSRILAEYETLLTEHQLRDPEDRLDQAASRIGSSDLVKGRHVFVDGYMSFTVPEIRVLTALAMAAESFVLTLCVDPEDLIVYRAATDEARRMGLPFPEAGFPRTVYGSLERPIFSPTARTLLLVEDAFSREGLKARIRNLPSTPRFVSTSLAELEREALCSGEAEEKKAPERSEKQGAGDIEILAAVHPEQEVLAWARRIDRWVRLGELDGARQTQSNGSQLPQPERSGARYRDVAVLLRDPAAYAGLIQEIFPRYDIPFFIDLPTDLTFHPIPATLLAALGVLEHRWNRPSVMSLLRSPLLGLTRLEADLLENVSLEYGIEFHRWHKEEWKAYIPPPRRKTARPRDAETREEDHEHHEEDDDVDLAATDRRYRIQKAQVDLGNRIRETILLRIRKYEEEWGDGTISFRDAARGLIRLAEDLDLIGRQEQLAIAQDERAVARQVLTSFSSLLEDGVRLMGDVPVTPTLFAQLIRNGLRALRLARTPQSLDAVTIGDFQRSRINEARAVIVGGLTAEAVPRSVPDRPLLNEDEERWMSKAGLSTGPSPQARQDEEAYLTYIAWTRARECLLLTFPSSTTTGDSLHVSPYLSLVSRRLGIDLPTPTPEAGRQGIQTSEELAARLGRELSRHIADEEAGRDIPQASHEMPIHQIYNEALQTQPESPSLHVMRKALIHQRPGRLSPDVLAVLYPRGELMTSPSALETFGRCPYQSFARRNLRIEPRPEAVVQPRDTGMALHSALEKLFGRRDLPSPEEVRNKLEGIFQDLLKEKEFLAFDLDGPSRYQWNSSRRGLTHFASAEAGRLEKARYKPGGVEVSFGFPEGKPHLVVPAGADRRILIRGRMDRVDIPDDVPWDATEGAQAIVLDYKRSFGTRAVRTELEEGERLQTGIYMLALQDVFDLSPVGGFYVAVLPAPVTPDKRGDAANPLGFKFRGIILGDEVTSYDPDKAFIGSLKGGGKTTMSPEAMDEILSLTRAYIADFGRRTLDGEIRAVPYQRSGSDLPRVCEYCDYRDLCRFDPMRHPVLRAHSRPETDKSGEGSS